MWFRLNHFDGEEPAVYDLIKSCNKLIFLAKLVFQFKQRQRKYVHKAATSLSPSSCDARYCIREVLDQCNIFMISSYYKLSLKGSVTENDLTVMGNRGTREMLLRLRCWCLGQGWLGSLWPKG